MARRAQVLLLLFLLAVTGGCQSEPSVPSAKISGQVTIGGKPIEQGNIQFMPQEGNLGSAVPATITNGAYEAEVPVGKLKAMFYATKPTGKMLPGYSKPEPEIVNIIPPAAQGGIDFEVTGDNPSQNFELEQP